MATTTTKKTEWKQYRQTGNLNDLNKMSAKETKTQKKKRSQRNVFACAQPLHWRANSLGLSLSAHLQNHFICHRKSLIWDCFMLCTRGNMLSTWVADSFDYFAPPHFLHHSHPIHWRFFLSALFSFHRENYFCARKSRVERLNFRFFFEFVSICLIQLMRSVGWLCDIEVYFIIFKFCVVKRFAIAHEIIYMCAILSAPYIYIQLGIQPWLILRQWFRQNENGNIVFTIFKHYIFKVKQ